MIITLNLETMNPPGSFPNPDSVKAPKNYKDPAKIKAYQIENAVDRWENLKVQLPNAHVFCISSMAEGDEKPTVLMHNNERELLTAFQNMIPGFVEQAQGLPLVWVTFNGLKFDFPMMFVRALKYDLSILARQMQLFRGRYGDDCHVDVLQLLGGEHSLDEWIHFFGIEVDNPITGAQISEALLRQQHDQIMRHSISRVVGAYEIYKILRRNGVAR